VPRLAAPTHSGCRCRQGPSNQGRLNTADHSSLTLTQQHSPARSTLNHSNCESCVGAQRATGHRPSSLPKRSGSGRRLPLQCVLRAPVRHGVCKAWRVRGMACVRCLAALVCPCRPPCRRQDGFKREPPARGLGCATPREGRLSAVTLEARVLVGDGHAGACRRALIECACSCAAGGGTCAWCASDELHCWMVSRSAQLMRLRVAHLASLCGAPRHCHKGQTSHEQTPAIV
jgi:hypothetical protein